MLYTKELAQELKQAIEDIELKATDDKDFMFDVVATTEDKDRDNEVIKINGWDTKNWMKNPVILANHSYTIENIVWKWLKFYTSNGQKRLKWVFSKTNPLWILAKDLYNEWMLKSVSVGFIPLQRNDKDYKIIEKAELLEVSFVAVPCNPNALSLDEKLYNEAIKKWLLKEEEEVIEEEKKELEVIEELEVKEINELDEIRTELKEIKEILKSMTDDKVKETDLEEIQEQEADIKAKKEVLQAINKATATALQNLKKL